MGFEYKLIKIEEEGYKELEVVIQEESAEDFCELMGWDDTQFVNNTVRYPVFGEDSGDEVITEEAHCEEKMPKPKKKGGRGKYNQKYDEEQLNWLRGNIDKYKNSDLVVVFNKKFDLGVSMNSVVVKMSNEGIKRKLKGELVKKKPEKEVKRVHYSEEHFDWLRENMDVTKNHRELWELFNKKFDLDISFDALKTQLARHDILRMTGNSSSRPKLGEHREFQKNQGSTDKKELSQRKGMTEEAVGIIEDGYMELNDEELREKIADKTGSFFSVDKIEDYRDSNGMSRSRGWKPEGFDLTEDEDAES